MTLTKEQILNNLIKYNVISAIEAKRFNTAKRETIVRFMNEHLPANVIKEIYEYEYCTDKDERDYTPIKDFKPHLTNQPDSTEIIYSQEISNRENKHKVTVGDLLLQGKLKNFNKKEKKKEKIFVAAISDETVKKVLDKIEEIY